MIAPLHITNGDCAADLIRDAGLPGEILPWRDVLHDGPVPGDLSLAEMSRVRASFLCSGDAQSFSDLAQEFIARDTLLERFPEFERLVLWFEWDLYDQLQLIQILDAIAHRTEALDGHELPPIEHVSLAGYLGNLPSDRYPLVYDERKDVTREMVKLGQAAWRAFTSPDPTDIVALLEAGTAHLPFLEGAMWRALEELPSTRNGLSRAEHQLLEALAEGHSTFSDVFRFAAEREERVYCGDSSAADYLERLSTGDEPLVVLPSGERVRAPKAPSEMREFLNAPLVLTEAGKDVLAGKRDWISMGGSDRWVGGVHLEGPNAGWRWDAERRTAIEANVA